MPSEALLRELGFEIIDEGKNHPFDRFLILHLPCDYIIEMNAFFDFRVSYLGMNDVALSFSGEDHLRSFVSTFTDPF